MTNQIFEKHIPPGLFEIVQKITEGIRIKTEEGLLLYEKAPLSLLGLLAHDIRVKKNGQETYFLRNIHIEPTNICKHECLFCSYNHRYAGFGWELTPEEILGKIEKEAKNALEVHITGGVHPDRDIYYYASMIKGIKNIRPDIHIKAFSAVELDDMITQSGMNLADGLQFLKDHGLDSIPGGGAEIFDSVLRKKICGDKSTAERYLEIHTNAHQLGISSNATMLYGHFENTEQRIHHLDLLRQTQDITGGFNAFIPLKFRNKNNKLSQLQETPLTDDIRIFAFSRIFLDNFKHIKAYWPMLGKSHTQMLMNFGVDDIDGTIEDSTRIYSLAGSEEQNPSMQIEEFINFVRQAGFIPVERDSLYRKLKVYDE
ncbi:MAG: CofH family radical SAM protein [Bacteroidales bacterium]|nr:CofH family radical SAM protein [Bacteroidales bacterium]